MYGRLVEIINEKLGIDAREKTTSGEVVKALARNGLGGTVISSNDVTTLI
ncbi:MAG: hypothetical protein WBA93_02195 [Microcoleaceae cyanobacterium]